MNEIAILFKSARLKKKLSQKQLSDLVKISQGAISKYETGRQMPRVAELFRLVKVLKIPIRKIARLEDVFFKFNFLNEHRGLRQSAKDSNKKNCSLVRKG